MRREWRKVLAIGVLFLAGVVCDAAPQDVQTERRGLGAAAVRLTFELEWGPSGNGAGDAQRPGVDSALSLDLSEGRVLGAMPWPPRPPGEAAGPPGWGPAEAGGWRLGHEVEGRARARIEVPVEAKLIVRRGDQTVSVPVAAVLERPQRTPATAPMAVGAKLWLVGPLGFRTDDYYLRRAGLDYWQHLLWEVVDDWATLRERLPAGLEAVHHG